MKIITEPWTHSPIREHAANLITAQLDDGLKNLRAQLAAATDSQERVTIERRIAERKRFLERMAK